VTGIVICGDRLVYLHCSLAKSWKAMKGESRDSGYKLGTMPLRDKYGALSSRLMVRCSIKKNILLQNTKKFF
jgi:hypothetical protein